MKHIVVRPSGKDLSSVSILDAAATVAHPFESWVLESGKSVVWANVRMANLLKNSYVYGSFQTKAVYTYTYEEMCAIVTSHIGPSDRETYEAAVANLQTLKDDRKRKPMYDKWQRWFYGSLVSAEIVWTVFFTIGKVAEAILKLILIPIVIAFVKKPK